MEPGVAVLLLLLAVCFGGLVRAYLVGGGFWFPGWRVTRTRDPITFWLVVLAYGSVAALAAVAGVVGLLYGHTRISD